MARRLLAEPVESSSRIKMRDRCQRCLYALALTGCLWWSAAAAEPARVALMDFSTDDNSYRSALAAVDFSALLQVKLKDVDGLEWVERSQLQAAEKELKLSTVGFVSLSSALHVGKFVKADLLAVGQFTITSQHERLLHLEIINLEHADVLAEASLPMADAPDKPLAVSTMDVAAAENFFRTIFKQALESQSRMKNQTMIAPLFFANTSSSRRLDYLETELQSALAETVARGGARVLQFPRANIAAGEAELVVAGLVEQDPIAWQKVADIYVWGRYEEAKTEGLAFEQTPVTFTLNLWDGSDEMQTVTETAKVSELPQLKERLVKRVLAAAQSFKKRPPSETARRQVARQLLLRACDILAIFKAGGTPSSSPLYLTSQGQQLWCYEIKLLATAHFFAPDSYFIHRLWLERRWHRLVFSWDFRTLPEPRDLFWQQLEQIRSYADFDDKFGLITPKEMDADLRPEGQWFFFSRPREVDSALEASWSGALREFGDTINGENKAGVPVKKMPGFPMDAPRAVLESWRDQMSDDLTRRIFALYETAIHASPPIPVPNAHLLLEGAAFNLKDRELKAKFVEDLWPAYLEHFGESTARHEYSAEEYDVYFTRGTLAKVQQIFADVGRPQQAAAMIAQFKQRVKIVGNPSAAWEAAEANRQKLVAVELLPPRLKPELQYVQFREKTMVDGVVALKFNDGVLWISTRAGAMTWSDPAWEYLTRSHTNAAVWRLSANSSAPEIISAKLGQHSKVTSFCAQNDKLWLTLEQDGVFCFSPETSQNTRYGDKQGVLSRQMFASALMGERLYFGGGEPNNGKLNYVELPGRLWKSQDLGDKSSAPIVLLQPFGNRLLVNDRILDTGSGAWRSIRDELLEGNTPRGNQQMQPLRFDLLAATADSSVLWLGNTLGLCSYNPDTGARHDWFSLPGGYLVNSKGVAMTVTSGYHLAENGVYTADTNNTAVTTAVPTSRLTGRRNCIGERWRFPVDRFNYTI